MVVLRRNLTDGRWLAAIVANDSIARTAARRRSSTALLGIIGYEKVRECDPPVQSISTRSDLNYLNHSEHFKLLSIWLFLRAVALESSLTQGFVIGVRCFSILDFTKSFACLDLTARVMTRKPC